MTYYISLCYVYHTVGPEWVGLKGRGLSQGVLTVKVECESTGGEKKSSKFICITSHYVKAIYISLHLYILAKTFLP